MGPTEAFWGLLIDGTSVGRVDEVVVWVAIVELVAEAVVTELVCKLAGGGTSEKVSYEGGGTERKKRVVYYTFICHIDQYKL